MRCRKIIQINNSEFNDPGFIPDDAFFEKIEIDDLYLGMLKDTIDGRLLYRVCPDDKINFYKDLISKTANKLLKLAYFEYIKNSISDSDRFQLLNMKGLIPLYFEVALNIILRENTHYRPMHLIKEYINLSHKFNILNQEMFDNVGVILKKIKSQEEKTHIKDIEFILEYFIDKNKKVLSSATIPSEIFNTIDYWVNNLFDGNFTMYLQFTDKTLDFYKKLDMLDDLNDKRKVFARKFMKFYDDKISDNQWNEKNMQSMATKHHFLNEKLKIIQTYCPERADLKNEVKIEIERIGKTIPDCREGCAKISGLIKVDFKPFMEEFKDVTLEAFIKKTVIYDYFIPLKSPPPDSADFHLMQFIPTMYYDKDSTKRVQQPERWYYYNFAWDFKLRLFQIIIERFDKNKLFDIIFSVFYCSEVINAITKDFLYGALKYFFDGNYYASMISCVFQVEIVLRDICIKNNIETISIEEAKTRQKSIGSYITKLRENKLVNERLLLFIEWFLLNENDQISKNVRHQIAHGMNSKEQFDNIFSKENAISLILIFLGLSKY